MTIVLAAITFAWVSTARGESRHGRRRDDGEGSAGETLGGAAPLVARR